MELKISHNGGFFSCSTVALLDIVRFYNEHGRLPESIDRTEQYINYKADHSMNLIPFYFDECNLLTPTNKIELIDDCMRIQFDSYKNIDYKNLHSIISNYFYPAENVEDIMCDLIDNYRLDFENLCAVFYRGNDKAREMKVPSYQSFIDKAKEIKEKNPNIRFLVQPDEKEFLEAFLKEFPDSIYFTETPMLSKQDSAMFFEIPQPDRALYGAKFFAAVLCLSQCKEVITHSGNGALWLCLYRRNADNVHQIFNDVWLS